MKVYFCICTLWIATFSLKAHSSELYSKVLVASGMNLLPPADDLVTEIIDFENENSMCAKWPKFSGPLIGTTGHLVGSKPIICGGYQYTKNCYELTSSGENLFSIMEEYRNSAASIAFDEVTLWVLGGNGNNGNTFDSTEFISQNSTKTGPKMPENLLGHSILRLSKTSFFLIGGGRTNQFYKGSNKTYIYNSETEGWSKGPEMISGRVFHSSGIVIDKVTSEPIVVVGGGSDTIGSVEILPLYSENLNWIQGPSLYLVSHGGAMVSLGPDLFFIGAEGIYLLECYDYECFWTQMKQKLDTYRANFVAFGIPDTLVNCH